MTPVGAHSPGDTRQPVEDKPVALVRGRNGLIAVVVSVLVGLVGQDLQGCIEHIGGAGSELPLIADVAVLVLIGVIEVACPHLEQRVEVEGMASRWVLPASGARAHYMTSDTTGPTVLPLRGRYLRSLYPQSVRIVLVCDNFSPYLRTAEDARVAD